LLQKDVISTQKQPDYIKKDAALFEMASVKKVVKSKGWLRNGCDGIHRLMAENLTTTIQVNFCDDS